MLVKAVNLVATLLGHPIHWDTETVGCEPSLSSIDVTAQRSFADALAELAAWLALPGNEQEFLLVFLDDQPDIKDWVSACDIMFCASGSSTLTSGSSPMRAMAFRHQVLTQCSDTVTCPNRGLHFL